MERTTLYLSQTLSVSDTKSPLVNSQATGKHLTTEYPTDPQVTVINAPSKEPPAESYVTAIADKIAKPPRETDHHPDFMIPTHPTLPTTVPVNHKITHKKQIIFSSTATTVIIERVEKRVPKIAKEIASLEDDEVRLVSDLFRSIILSFIGRRICLETSV